MLLCLGQKYPMDLPCLMQPHTEERLREILSGASRRCSDPLCGCKQVCSSMLLSLWLPAGLWLYLAWRIVRSGRQGRGLAWVRHALSMAGRQFKVHLVRLGFGAKVCLHLLA